MTRMPSNCPASLRISVKCGMLKLQNIWRYRYDKISCKASASYCVFSDLHYAQAFILAVQRYAVSVGVDVLAFQYVTCSRRGVHAFHGDGPTGRMRTCACISCESIRTADARSEACDGR